MGQFLAAFKDQAQFQKMTWDSSIMTKVTATARSATGSQLSFRTSQVVTGHMYHPAHKSQALLHVSTELQRTIVYASADKISRGEQRRTETRNRLT